MMKELWLADAEVLASQLRPGHGVEPRVAYLLGRVTPRLTECGPDVFMQKDITLPEDTPHLLVERGLLVKSPTRLGELARTLRGVAFVAHSRCAPSVMVLPEHATTAPLGNGHIFIHELEHITEPDEGVLSPQYNSGMKERRAYSTNRRIMHDIDGSDFVRFVDAWPVSFEVTERDNTFMARIDFHDVTCPEPQPETLAHAIWQEGTQSKLLLQSVARMAVLEKLTDGLPHNLIAELIQNVHSH